MNLTPYALIVAILGLGATSALRANDSKLAELLVLTPELQERCLGILRGGIGSGEFWPGIHAAEALTLAGSSDAVLRAFRERLPMEKDDQRRCGLARELVRAGDRSFLPVLFTILGNVHSTGRGHAAESLYKLGEIGDGTLLRAAIVQKDDLPLQAYAAAALAKSGDAGALAHLRQLLRSDDRRLRNVAAYALSQVGNESDIKPLQEALKQETDGGARGMLVNTLAVLGDSEARKQLGVDLDSSDAGVRVMAAEFAGHSRAIEYHAKLVKLLDDRTLDVRVRAAEALMVLSRPAAKR